LLLPDGGGYRRHRLAAHAYVLNTSSPRRGFLDDAVNLFGFGNTGRAVDDDSDPGSGDSAQNETLSSWAIFISILLLITAFLTSYLLQQKKVEAVHETVISIFAGTIRYPLDLGRSFHRMCKMANERETQAW